MLYVYSVVEQSTSEYYYSTRVVCILCILLLEYSGVLASTH